MCRRESESVQDVGSTPLMPHIFLSSCRDSRNKKFAGSELPARIYVGIEHRAGEGVLETHAIQIFDQPHQIVTLQVRNNPSVLVAVNEIAELLAEMWRSSIKVVEPL